MRRSDLKSEPVVLSEHGLFGVYTESKETPCPVGVIALNAGMLDCPGPYRLYIDLAERLAADAGIASLRLDLSGKGETPRRDRCSPSESVLLDFDDAVFYLNTRGIHSIALLGMCSGAIDALWIASQRSGVNALVLLDGYYERTLRSIVRHYGARLFSGDSWVNWRGRLTGGVERDSSVDVLDDLRDFGRLAGMRDRYRQLLASGVDVLSIFSGSWFHYNYEGQLRDFIGGPVEPLGRLTEIRFEQADHVYTLSRHREMVVQEIDTWMAQYASRRLGASDR